MDIFKTSLFLIQKYPGAECSASGQIRYKGGCSPIEPSGPFLRAQPVFPVCIPCPATRHSTATHSVFHHHGARSSLHQSCRFVGDGCIISPLSYFVNRFFPFFKLSHPFCHVRRSVPISVDSFCKVGLILSSFPLFRAQKSCCNSVLAIAAAFDLIMYSPVPGQVPIIWSNQFISSAARCSSSVFGCHSGSAGGWAAACGSGSASSACTGSG